VAIPYTKTDTSLTLVVGFRPTVIPSSHPNFAKLAQLAKEPRTTENDIIPLLDIPAAITAFSGDEIKVVNGKLFYRGVEVKDNLAKIILDFVKSGDPTAALPFQMFLANCRANPDPQLVETIYDWCVKGNLPITPDGELIAWKIVDRNYQSKHAGKRGKLDHSIGAVVTEPREECDPNRNQTCSTGIHFASVEYIEKGHYGSISGGDRIVAVVINPRDITAIPTDYNLSKGRCCELRVVGEIERQDQLNDFYGTAKVYGGWQAPPAPRKSAVVDVVQQFHLKDGDEVVTRDGKTVKVTAAGSSSNLCRTTGFVFRETGICANTKAGQVIGYEAPQDVIRVISRAADKPATPPAARSLFTSPLRDGDKVRLVDGRTGTVTKVGAHASNVCRINLSDGTTTTSKFRRNGCGNNPGGFGSFDNVEAIIRRAETTPRTSGGLAARQVWLTRGGEQRTIDRINGVSNYPVVDTEGRSYTASGRFSGDNSVSQLDLVRLVTDVA